MIPRAHTRPETLAFQPARWKVLTEYSGDLGNSPKGSYFSIRSRARLVQSKGYVS